MVYCISDLHGCYDEFMALLDRIKFNPQHDELYILGDAVDRGNRPIDCLKFIMNTKNVYFIMGNHEQMMLDYYDGKDFEGIWNWNGNEVTKAQLGDLSPIDCASVFLYLRKSPYCKIISVKGKQYFLSHAGLDASAPVDRQTKDALLWSRGNFYRKRAREDYTCIFGHTPTPNLHDDYYNYSVWYDRVYSDKICIDCACVYGGRLAALRLDDGAIFYVKRTYV
jgi:serine/threonine protein phosphatase 1